MTRAHAEARESGGWVLDLLLGNADRPDVHGRDGLPVHGAVVGWMAVGGDSPPRVMTMDVSIAR